MLRLPVVFLMLLALAMAGFGSAAATAAETAGTVLALSGDCSVDAAGTHRALRLNDAVHVGDTVVVATGARLKLRMADGSVVAAASGTTVTIDAYAVDEAGHRHDARLSLAGGLVRAVVSSMTAPSHFEIGTATAVAAVRSTDWFIEAKPDLTRVGVLDGLVALTARASGASVDIPKRYGSRVESHADPTTPRPWSTPEFDEYIAATALP
jgi:hypothetical protein